MLVPSYGTCDLCGDSLDGTLLQTTQCTCSKCERVINACTACSQLPCLRCGGKMESAFDRAADDGILF